ncbi:MAG: hypothetical protein ACLQOO_05550 [Terriglobia bacterium]
MSEELAQFLAEQVWRVDARLRRRTKNRKNVESHVEQFYLEALYYTWKASGDNEWMKAKLDGAIKAVRYVTSDPYRWSEMYQLMRSVHRKN